MLAVRGDAYRQDLGDLTDDAWEWAVSQARRSRWFPSIQELLDLAARAPISAAESRRRDERRDSKLALPPPASDRIVSPPLSLFEDLVRETPPPAFGSHPSSQQVLAYLHLISGQAGIKHNGPLWSGESARAERAEEARRRVLRFAARTEPGEPGEEE